VKQVPAVDWLSEVEASVRRAHAILLSPSPDGLVRCQQELDTAVTRLEEFCDSAAESADPGIGPRLWMLRKQILLLGAMIRQASAFYRGVEQADPQSVLGYTTAGLERAL
jgi:hypothetical protein